MAYSDIVVGRENRVGTIAIHRPGANNSVRAETMDEIRHAVEALIDDADVAALVLTSTGRHFVTGAEFSFLQELATTPALAVKDRVYRSFQGAARSLYHCPKPTLAAINGAAVTVGCELALMCDFRIASETAFFQESWIKLGLLPPLGGLSVYGASKAAVQTLTKGLAREWARSGIAVNAISPGYIATEINGAWLATEGGQRRIKGFPRRRVMDADVLDDAVLMLAGPKARYITGTIITIDDGQLL
ncbi:MAG: enoyl-CoA hydratase [Phenylobacterium sp.]|nr:enoyl-CoA hydratase [Phenylobacterium sp.]